MKELDLLIKKAIVLLGERTTCIYQAERLKENYADYEAQLVSAKKSMENCRLEQQDIHRRIAEVNEVLDAILEKAERLNSAEFMSALYLADDYTDINYDIRVGDILANFQFNNKV